MHPVISFSLFRYGSQPSCVCLLQLLHNFTQQTLLNSQHQQSTYTKVIFLFVDHHDPGYQSLSPVLISHPHQSMYCIGCSFLPPYSVFFLLRKMWRRNSTFCACLSGYRRCFNYSLKQVFSLNKKKNGVKILRAIQDARIVELKSKGN